jgi:hypothetical protein
MSYKINKTDGTILTEVLDGTIDQVSSDVTLVGLNTSRYGEYINENFVHLLENFANTDQPTNPITGQLWYDTAERRLKVHDTGTFKPAGGPIVSPTAPVEPLPGDFWIDNVENQLYFYTGPTGSSITNQYLAGPIYTQTQGKSGFVVENHRDGAGNLRVLLELWAKDVLMGIFSPYPEEFQVDIVGFNGIGEVISPGFNQGSTIAGMKFKTVATQAETTISTILPRYATADLPVGAEIGTLVYDTSDNKAKVYTGTDWQALN